jgi:DNA-binding SARP family transcriptional activator
MATLEGRRSPPCPPGSLELSLLGPFELRCEKRSVPLSTNAQRLLAFLALHPHPIMRVHVAATLWTDSCDERAFASLRSLLWRLPRPGCPLVQATVRHVQLSPYVAVDFRAAAILANRLLDDGCEDPERDEQTWALLDRVLLPDWYDDWVVAERERYRQLALHALEALSERLVAAGRYRRALVAALAAVASDPLRESAHRALINVHLAEGNVAEASRQYHVFKDLLDARLGLAPSPRLRSMVAGFTPP